METFKAELILALPFTFLPLFFPLRLLPRVITGKVSSSTGTTIFRENMRSPSSSLANSFQIRRVGLFMKTQRSLHKLSGKKYGYSVRAFLPWLGKKETTQTGHKNPVGVDPFEDAGHLELAKAYLKMGLREKALDQYRILAQHYTSSGMEDKADMVMALMARIDSNKPGPEKRITSLKQPTTEGKRRNGARPRLAGIQEAFIPAEGNEVRFDLGAELEIDESEGSRNVDVKDSLSNYNKGLAFLESGAMDDAVRQFQIGYEKGENRFEAARLLGLCFKEKGMWREAIQAFEKALRVGGISQPDMLAVKSQLGLIFKEQGKTEEALKLFREKSGVELRIRRETSGSIRAAKKSVRK